MTDNTFTPGPTPNTVRSADGKVLTAPEGWILLPPGDAALTRRVKAAGDHWVVQEKKGRKVFSRGVWAAAATIDKIRAELEAERSTEALCQTEGGRRPTPRKSSGRIRRRLLRGGAEVPGLPSRTRRPRRQAGPCDCRSRHSGRKRHRRQDKANPCRTTCRSRRHCVDAAPDHRLRVDEDPQGQRKTAGSSTDAGPTIQGIVEPVSERGGGWRDCPLKKALTGMR